MQQGEDTARPISEAEDIGPYRLASPLEVGFILRSLVQRADFVTIYFNGGHDMMLTRILDVDMKAHRFVFDLSGHGPSNEALQKAEKAVFVALPEGVKVQFSTRQVRTATFEGAPALIAPFPPDVIKLQRREFFRQPTPISSPYFCRLALAGDEPIRLEVRDVSLGGVGMWFPEGLIDKIDIGMRFSQALFDFGPGGTMRVDIEIRNCRSLVGRQGQMQYIVGVRFIHLGRAQEASLQKLISHLERERKALLG